uniref:Uncharacterized protein TCIL3000_11_10550 n=1 Tax=Trypanosoma congolense (strain IL3000) TaxID=1068625 RepID=G0V1R1_TRYCI|nr:unnamed protein product [Trypanosoma congolense IL3000]
MSTMLVPKIHCVGEVSSTMDVVREMLTTSPTDVPPFAVLAESQTSGRGTTARQWLSPPGNMYLTLCLPLGAVREELLSVLPLLIGLACRAAVMELVKGATIHVKWPNDVIYAAQKIGGSIVESVGTNLIIGIGMNVEVAPPVPDGGRPSYAINSLAASLGQEPITPKSLAEVVCRNVCASATGKELTRAALVEQFEAVMDKSLELHRRTTVGRDPIPLYAVRLNEWGHLVVRHPSGAEEVLVAEYLF